jgi:hypothetical protein
MRLMLIWSLSQNVAAMRSQLAIRDLAAIFAKVCNDGVTSAARWVSADANFCTRFILPPIKLKA